MPVLSFDSRTTISGTNVCVNTWHIAVNNQPLITEGNNLLAAVNALYNSLAAQRQGGSTTVTGSRVLYFHESWWTKPVGKPGTPGYVKGFFNTPQIIMATSPVTSNAGTGTGGLPPQLASVISWRTAFAGRSGRGRTYLGQLAGTAMTNSVVTPATVTAINSAATTLISAVAAITAAGAPAALAVWSPTRGSTTVITSGSSDGTWDTMRSRVK